MLRPDDELAPDGEIGRRANRILAVAQSVAEQVRREADDYAQKRRQDADAANVDIERMHSEMARQFKVAAELTAEAKRLVDGARADAEAHLDVALGQANEITVSAESQANEALLAALAEADKIREDARQQAEQVVQRGHADRKSVV